MRQIAQHAHPTPVRRDMMNGGLSWFLAVCIHESDEKRGVLLGIFHRFKDQIRFALNKSGYDLFVWEPMLVQ